MNLSKINKLHELLTIALDDLKKCEADPTYIINMHEWHVPRGEQCSICLAGAVMAQSLGAYPSEHRSLFSYDAPLDERLEALDDLRCGGIVDACHTMGIPSRWEEHKTSRIDVPDYNDKEHWWQAMGEVLRFLKEWDL